MIDVGNGSTINVSPYPRKHGQIVTTSGIAQTVIRDLLIVTLSEIKIYLFIAIKTT